MGQGLAASGILNPRTGEPFRVPALVLPDERDLVLALRQG